MKKAILITLLVLCICTLAQAETGRRYFPDGSYVDTVVVPYQFTGSVVNYEILSEWNAGGNSFVIDHMLISSANAIYLYLNDSGTKGDVGWGYYRVVAGEGLIDRDTTLKCSAAAGLYVTASGAGEMQVEYHLE